MTKGMILAAGLALFAGPAAAQVTLDQVRGATTVAEFLALGARQLTASQFEATVVGKLLDEGGWTWTINADGTHESAADDGSWSDSGGPWEMQGNRYCRRTLAETTMTCSDAYEIGGYLRFGDESGALAGWTVRIR